MFHSLDIDTDRHGLCLAIMIQTLNQLVDALTGLERILTTPIPFSSVLILTHRFSTFLTERALIFHEIGTRCICGQ